MSWEPPLPVGWTDIHRAFLQALMARGSLTLRDAQPILASLFNLDKPVGENGINSDDIEAEDMESIVNIAREAIMPLDYDIKKHRHQATKDEHWVFVNVHSDPSTQLATTYTADEISFIKRLLDAIFETYNTPRLELMCITEDQALKLSRPGRGRESMNGAANGDAGSNAQAAADKRLKHSEVLALMASLRDEGWLEKSAAGFYSLSPRALMELWSWIIESYNEPEAGANEWQRVKNCEACKDIVTVGQRCSNLDCIVRLHDICQEAFWRSRRDQNCPKCHTPWDGKYLVGEKAITSTAAYQRSRQRGGARASDIVRSVMESAGEDGEDEE